VTTLTDDAMRSQVLNLINTIPDVKPGDVEVFVHDAVVTLCGMVASPKVLFDMENRITKINGMHGLQLYVHCDIAPPAPLPNKFFGSTQSGVGALIGPAPSIGKQRHRHV
jgi:hypothetical protein